MLNYNASNRSVAVSVAVCIYRHSGYNRPQLHCLNCLLCLKNMNKRLL